MGNIEAEDAAVITTTAGCAPWHRAAERAAHDERRGSGNACHRYDTRRGSGGKAWRASRQGVLHVITTTVGRILRHRAAGQAAAHGKIIDAVGTAYRTYDSVSCIVPSCRREGGIARRTSRQRVLPVITTTVGHTSLHRAAGRAAAHHEHRGSGNTCHRYDTRRRAGGIAGRPWRQWINRGIAPPRVGRQCMESIEVVGTACHHYDSGHILRHCAAGRAAALGEIIDAVGTAYFTYDSESCIGSSCRREGGIAWRTSRHRVLPVITPTAGRTSWHCAAGRAAAHHKQRGSGNACHHDDTRRRAGGVAWIAFRQWSLPVITTTAVSYICRRSGGIAGRASRQWIHRGTAPPPVGR